MSPPYYRISNQNRCRQFKSQATIVTETLVFQARMHFQNCDHDDRLRIVCEHESKTAEHHRPSRQSKKQQSMPSAKHSGGRLANRVCGARQ
jgi:hypothetical protein